jgi:chloramphenicol-sensitive protein RarD
MAGIWAGVGAYTLWGVLALYWKLLAHVPPLEILAHRILWSFVFGALLLTVRREWSAVRSVLTDGRSLGAVALSTVLIAINWFLFIWAVSQHRVTEISLGYYINPLFNVLLGAVVLSERLRRAQRWAVALAGLGVSWFVVSLGTLPWVSLVLAFSFGCYGLVRKLSPAGPIDGLTLEAGGLTAVALVGLTGGFVPVDGHFGADLGTTALLVFGGPLTALPLLLFAVAARRIPYSTLGMLQYIAPTLQLLCAVTAFDEPFTQRHLVTFSFVWSGLGLFAYDTFSRRPRAAPVRA